jgi:hypothetical protein
MEGSPMEGVGPVAPRRSQDHRRPDPSEQLYTDCWLVIIGARPEGKKELVGLIDGVCESAHSWKEQTDFPSIERFLAGWPVLGES